MTMFGLIVLNHFISLKP